jgi:hypothetical protein
VIDPAATRDFKVEKMFTRVFRIDSTTLIYGLENALGPIEGKHPAPQGDVYAALLKFLKTRNIELQPPKSIFFNDREGSILVHASEADIRLIEQALVLLNAPPLQLNVKVKFVIPPGTESFVNGLRTYFLHLLNENGSRAGGNTVPLQADPTVVILTDPQLRIVLEKMEHDGAKSVNEASVTTLSGRQTQVQWTDSKSVVEINPLALTTPGVHDTNLLYLTGKIPFGSLVDLLPTVSRAGSTISLDIGSSYSELVGYDQSAASATVYVDGKPQNITLLIPAVLSQKLERRTMAVRDGCTVVILGTAESSIVTNKIPVLGDVPLLGKLFQTRTPNRRVSTNRNLLMFATVTIIDSQGNRFHASEER